jgi:hypothetical protein
VAKPSPISNDNWGTLDKLPNNDGLFIRFVPQLQIHEVGLVPNVISRYFIQSFSSDFHETSAIVRKLNTHWKRIHDTQFGLRMTHICKCIEIAILAQSRAYPIFTHGYYQGTVICGSRYTVTVDGRTYGPSSYKDIQHMVVEWHASNHISSTIARVLRISQERVDNCSTMRQLSHLVRGLESTGTEKDSVVRYAQHLRITQTYESVTHASILRCLDLLSNGKDLPDDLPMFPDYIYSENRVEQVMSMFGPFGPSFQIPKSECISVDSSTPPEFLYSTTVSINKSIEHMKVLVKSRSITNNTKRLHSEHLHSAWDDVIQKRMVWQFLRKVARVFNQNDVDTRPICGTKRKRGSVFSDLF